MKVSAETGAAVKMGYRPGLDGVRALAAIAVVVAHYVAWDAGRYGVEVFFALSGFLITTILLEDVDAGGTVRLGRFYVRRARRLLPCLVAVVAVCAVLLPVLQPGTEDGLLPALLYYSNWQRSAGVELGSLGHTWSLAVEEQFYLVWPLVVLVTRRVRAPWMVAACVTGAVVLPFMGTTELMLGAAVAYGRRAGWRAPNIPSLGAVLAVRPLVWIGQRSYGLYLWHFPVGHVLNDHTPAGLVIATTATLVVVECSYRWIEMPFRSSHPVGDKERPRTDLGVRSIRGGLRPLELNVPSR